MASATRWKPGLNEDLKAGGERAGSPFSGRWASTTALPKPATKRFYLRGSEAGTVKVRRGATSPSSLALHSPRASAVPLSHTSQISLSLSLSLPREGLPRAALRRIARCYTNDPIFRNKCHCAISPCLRIQPPRLRHIPAFRYLYFPPGDRECRILRFPASFSTPARSFEITRIMQIANSKTSPGGIAAIDLRVAKVKRRRDRLIRPSLLLSSPLAQAHASAFVIDDNWPTGVFTDMDITKIPPGETRVLNGSHRERSD